MMNKQQAINMSIAELDQRSTSLRELMSGIGNLECGLLHVMLEERIDKATVDYDKLILTAALCGMMRAAIDDAEANDE